MYKIELDSKKVVGKCIDAIREGTNASLGDCHQSFQAVLQILEPFLGSSTQFPEIQETTATYEPDIDNCYDRKVLDSICSRLYDILLEKQELSYSSNDNDIELCQSLEVFCDITKKTDARIPLEIISRDNYDWLNQLITVLQMDQEPSVRQSIIETFHTILTCLDRKVIHALCDTQLPIVLVSMTSSNEDSKMLKVLALLYSTDVTPPLSHLDYLNIEYFSRLYSLNTDGDDVFNLSSNLFYLLKMSDLSTDCLIEPMVKNPYNCAKYAITMISSLNRICTVKRLMYVEAIIQLGKEVLENLFYDNDLKVLTHVLAREMINHSDDKVRKLCHTMLNTLINDCHVAPDAEIRESLSEFNVL